VNFYNCIFSFTSFDLKTWNFVIFLWNINHIMLLINLSLCLLSLLYIYSQVIHVNNKDYIEQHLIEIWTKLNNI